MKKFVLFIIVILVLPISVYAKRGCCSWHGGVSHCGENGRYVCNDGTYSPSCTCTPSVSYKYGCTNQNAINYDSSANRDDGSCIYRVYGCMNSSAINYNAFANTADGSCQFKEEITTEEEILYEVIIEKGQENKVKQEGSVGKKKIITKNIKDEAGNIISSEVVEEVIVEPVDEIRIEKVETVFKEEQSEEINEDNSQEENDTDSAGGLSLLLIIGLVIFGGYKLRNKN